MTVLGVPSVGREGFEALGFDPAPGELGNVEALGTQYKDVSRSLEAAHQALTRIGSSSGIWQGQAADNFRGTVGELPDYLDKAYRSLGDASTALQAWGADLGSMQRTAEDLERQAKQAQLRVEHAGSDPDLGLGGQFFPDAQSLQDAQRRLDEASRRLEEAQRELEAIREQARADTSAVSFRPPPGYAGIPLHEDPGQRAAAIRQLLAAAGPAGSAPPEVAAAGLGTLADLLRAANVQAAGVLTLPDLEPTERAGVVLAITALAGAAPEPSSAACRLLTEALAEQLRRDKPHADVRVVEVPAGPAAALIETGEYRLPRPDPDAEPQVVPMARAQAYLPAPDCRHLIVLDVSTSSVQHGERFAVLAVDLLRGISFTSDGSREVLAP